MSVRASLLAALVVGSSLTIAPASSAVAVARPEMANGATTAVAFADVAPDAAADVVAPEVTSVPVGPEPDGTAVRLDVSVWPQTSGKHPVVLLAHGFGGSKDSVTEQANALHERGYVVVAWSARGHGTSGGRIHLNDPAFEITDARALLDLAATRSDVDLDAPGDPRAGVMGGSYGGALGLMLAGADRRVDGVVSAITWNDLADAFFPQAGLSTAPTTAAGRAPITTPGPFKQVWATNFFLSANRGAGSDDGAVPADSCGRFDPTLCRLFVQASETGTASPELTALLRAHSPKPTMAEVTAPTLLVQGVATRSSDSTRPTPTRRRSPPPARRMPSGGVTGATTARAATRPRRPRRPTSGSTTTCATRPRSTGRCRPRPSRTASRPAAVASRAR